MPNNLPESEDFEVCIQKPVTFQFNIEINLRMQGSLIYQNYTFPFSYKLLQQMTIDNWLKNMSFFKIKHKVTSNSWCFLNLL